MSRGDGRARGQVGGAHAVALALVVAWSVVGCGSAGPAPTGSAGTAPNPTTPITGAQPSASGASGSGGVAPPITVVAAGDIACDPSNPAFARGRGVGQECRAAATEALIRRLDPTAVLPLGDEQYDNGSLDRFRHSYELSWGRERARSFPVPGNHEYETAGAAGYFAYFRDRAGPPGRGWYGFALGGWRFLALDGNCSIVGCDPGSAQYAWLRHELAAHPAVCTLAYWHQPRFSSGPHGDDLLVAPLWSLLFRAHADLVLNGHDHLYERFRPMTPKGTVDARGIREFVVGTGGAQHYAVATVHRGSAVRNDTTFGVLRLTLRADSYAWRFVPVAGGTFTDSGAASCR